ncbi:tRNA 2-methylthio-N6-isopentenyl adenosine(37) hydroxylase MiaE [bacterium]|nr:tRNA 2-methylthio-N6-isopentenyl adenosine(37) hydroxylase MiaE [bacterium]
MTKAYSGDTKSVLGLQLPTDPRWADLAGKQIEFILTDHAYCEQKAATTCISLIVQYPDKKELVERVSPLVTEEWGHFRMVLQELKKRNLTLGKQRKDEYVNQLLKQIRKGVGDYQLMDKLLVCALIEARSCERFKRLHEGLEEQALKDFYYALMVSEAGHYKLFIELAEVYFDKEEVRQRWLEMLQVEGEIMKSLTPRGDRIH